LEAEELIVSTKNPEAAPQAAQQGSSSPPAGPRPSSSPSPPPVRSSWLSRVIILLVILAAAGGLYAWYQSTHRQEDRSRLVLQGNIDVRQVNLGFKVDGRIASLLVDEGDEVTDGQILASLDKKYFNDDLARVRARRENAAATLSRLEHGSRPEEIAEARAQAAEQQATLARARQDYDRAEGLVGQGAVSRENFDLARSTLKQTEAKLAYAEQSLRLAEIGPRQEDIDAARAELAGQEAEMVQSERRLVDSDLISPSAGMVLTRAREKGAIVAAGETIFTVTLASPVWVRTYVNERDLGRIAPGMAAGVRTDSAPDKVYRGKIGFISPTAEFTPKTVETRELRTALVYRLRVVVDNPDQGLRQGMPVTVTLDLDNER
jgi:HlyD family secretion protein